MMVCNCSLCMLLRVVVGGGIMGVSIARQCAQALRKQGRVALIDQFDTSTHSRGSSHGDGRIFRQAVPACYCVACCVVGPWFRVYAER